jgi:hypothetical protein
VVLGDANPAISQHLAIISRGPKKCDDSVLTSGCSERLWGCNEYLVHVEEPAEKKSVDTVWDGYNLFAMARRQCPLQAVGLAQLSWVRAGLRFLRISLHGRTLRQHCSAALPSSGIFLTLGPIWRYATASNITSSCRISRSYDATLPSRAIPVAASRG